MKCTLHFLSRTLAMQAIEKQCLYQTKNKIIIKDMVPGYNEIKSTKKMKPLYKKRGDKSGVIMSIFGGIIGANLALLL